MISSQARVINEAFLGGSTPREQLTRAAAFLRIPKALIISIGIEAVGPIGKFKIERCVWGPQYFSMGTFTEPIVSFSVR